MILTTNIVVKRKRWTVYGRYPHGAYAGSGYCEDHIDRQYLIKEWRLFGLRVFKWTLDHEDVPVFASAQKALFGYTDWKSKFAEYITG